MCELTISQKHIITERNNSKGEYQPAFMQIRIHNSFDGNIDELDVPTSELLFMNTSTFFKMYQLRGDYMIVWFDII